MSSSKKGNYFKLLFEIKHTPGLEPVNDTPEIIVSTCGKEGGFMPKCKIRNANCGMCDKHAKQQSINY